MTGIVLILLSVAAGLCGIVGPVGRGASCDQDEVAADHGRFHSTFPASCG